MKKDIKRFIKKTNLLKDFHLNIIYIIHTILVLLKNHLNHFFKKYNKLLL